MDRPSADISEGLRRRYVVANAGELPFSDNAFDIGLSHAALDIDPETPESMNMIEEVMRVASDELRIAPLFLYPKEATLTRFRPSRS